MTVTTGLDQLLFDLQSVFTSIIGAVGDVYGVIVAQPLALVGFGVILAGVIVKFAKRIM
jgi:hypothetical protein